ncbi:hypothetical protein BDN71DRAFT_1149274 [Pleurotus eryngii]|uniref:Uncharacterized protein n=1 Tax=Pleurotus eryngii TaxID=5323 RepID=A0A9P6D581_PLEER|nr:hypothetical protein BDN71DRAFT_1149274 [Pleurotus eryngii]
MHPNLSPLSRLSHHHSQPLTFLNNASTLFCLVIIFSWAFTHLFLQVCSFAFRSNTGTLASAEPYSSSNISSLCFFFHLLPSFVSGTLFLSMARRSPAIVRKIPSTRTFSDSLTLSFSDCI